MPQAFDLIVIGGGSAGFAAARVASDLGKRVALIEQGPFGGLCILRGCMPSKTLLRSAEIAHEATHSQELGITVREMKIDYPAIVKRKDAIVKSFVDYRQEEVARRPLVTRIDGQAEFTDERHMRVNGELLTAPGFVLATGSRIRIPNIPGLAEQGYLTSDETLSITDLPQRLIIIGGGAIACEASQHLARMGVSVTILTRGPHLLSGEDPDFGRALAGYFQEEGITVKTGVTFHEVTRHGRAKMVVTTTEERRISFHGDELLVATGRVPNLDGLNLKAARIDETADGLALNEWLQTTNPAVFAAGDVAGRYELAHVAVHEGEVAGANALRGARRTPDYRIVPRVIFTDPPFARVGLSEAEARRLGRPVLSARYPYHDLGKAICTGQTKGFITMLADPDNGELLGAGLLGAGAPELIHEAVVAMHHRTTVGDLAVIPHFHPTLAEIFTYPAEELAARVMAGERHHA